jgi:hypothetical protein
MLPNPTADPAAVRMKPIRPEKLPLLAMYGIGFVLFERRAKYALNSNYQIRQWSTPEHLREPSELYYRHHKCDILHVCCNNLGKISLSPVRDKGYLGTEVEGRLGE